MIECTIFDLLNLSSHCWMSSGDTRLQHTAATHKHNCYIVIMLSYLLLPAPDVNPMCLCPPALPLYFHMRTSQGHPRDCHVRQGARTWWHHQPQQWWVSLTCSWTQSGALPVCCCGRHDCTIDAVAVMTAPVCSCQSTEPVANGPPNMRASAADAHAPALRWRTVRSGPHCRPAAAAAAASAACADHS
jgi:hypothetical protein